MASKIVVQKQETSILRQSRKFISINFKLGVGDYVWEVTSPDKVGSGPMWLFYSSTELQPIPVNQFSRTIAQNAVWCKEDLMGMRNV